ncbi:hypothetical protein [Microbulbifer halophilus]|uniref:Uncharacterized protein n=1 Tax=Microbulbifer halophilus TaxID=453963 RepID=A0ABW5EC31_9GAMM|nr:hypothetical protein [Microbulbifer halophilus]MCW8126236.1 hypothetical protein [Microbulbifer halophilus]
MCRTNACTRKIRCDCIYSPKPESEKIIHERAIPNTSVAQFSLLVDSKPQNERDFDSAIKKQNENSAIF